MQYKNSNTIVCIKSAKDACLYFNNVIPLNLAEIIPVTGNNDIEAFDVLKDILPPSLLDMSHPTNLSSLILKYIETYINAFPAAIGIETFKNKDYYDKRKHHFFPLLIDDSKRIMESLSYPINQVFGSSFFDDKKIENEDPALILSGLKLIDTSNIKWEHLLELRKDSDSLRKIRQLRTFIFENYKDKPLSFIEDDLLNRIYQYENSTKKWELKTKESVFKIIFNSGTAVAATIATIASICTGNPISISLPLGISSSFLIGNIVIEINSHKRNLNFLQNENPISYLIEAKKISNK